jgi:hypothetical protein
MPLEAYKRGKVWWAKGRVDLHGRPITGYIRESTGASDQSGAQDWIRERTDGERYRVLTGEQHRPITFNDALLLYDPTPQMAQALIPIARAIGSMLVRDITPALIRGLGPTLYPTNCTDHWRRWVITPARAVINNAHDQLGPAARRSRSRASPKRSGSTRTRRAGRPAESSAARAIGSGC